MQTLILHECNKTHFSGDANYWPMDGIESDRETIIALVQFSKLAPSALAKKAGLTPTTITRAYNGTASTRVSLPTWEKLREAVPEFPGWARHEPDLPPQDNSIEYVPVEVLPTYAGMGGGGNGDGEPEMALVPRYLIESVLRGNASDFVMIRCRGTSMEPLFRHDDELLVDKRDRSPTQPGPFALWDADWGEYLIKNVERLPGGRVRIFPSNPEFSASEVSNEETKILGRPVWFGRRL